MLLAISGMDSVIQLITVLLIFVLVLAITLFVTRWIGKYQKMQNVGDNVQVLESMRISPSVCVEILKIGRKYVAVAVAKESVTMLCELSEDEIIIRDDGSAEIGNFSNIFDAVKKSFSSKEVKALEESLEDEQ